MSDEQDLSRIIVTGFQELHNVMKERDARMDKLSDDISQLAHTVGMQTQNVDRLMHTLETHPSVMERLALIEAANKHTDSKLRVMFAFKDRITWGIIAALGTSTCALLAALFGLMSQ